MRPPKYTFVFVAACCLCCAGCGAAAAASSSRDVDSGFNLFQFFLYLVLVFIPGTALLLTSWFQHRNKWVAERIEEYPLAKKVLVGVDQILGPSVPAEARHPIKRWLLVPMFYLFAFYLTVGITVPLGFHFGLFLACTIGFLLMMGVIALRRRFAWYNYTLRWLYSRNGSVVGPFSSDQLAQLYRSKQIEPETPIRQIKDSEWRVGFLLEAPPRRVARGFVFGVVALIVGFPLSAGIFGKISHNGYTRHLAIEDFFEDFSPADVRRLHGMQDWEIDARGGVRTFDEQITRRTSGFLPQRIGEGVGQFTGSFSEDDRIMMRNVERAQNRTLGFTALVVLVSAFSGAALAPARVQVIKELPLDIA